MQYAILNPLDTDLNKVIRGNSVVMLEVSGPLPLRRLSTNMYESPRHWSALMAISLCHSQITTIL